MISYLYPPTPVSVSVPPLSFELDGVDTPVVQDTANAANNTPLPTGIYFIEDGVAIPVLEDTVTPANNKPLPVKLTGVTGDIIVNAGDLSVSITSTNDSTAIGDGVTGLLANVTTNGATGREELHVRDDGTNALLTAVEIDTTALAATIGTPGSAHVATGLQVLGSDGTNNRRLLTDATGILQVNATASALPSGAATLAEQQTQTTRLTSIRDAVELIDNSSNIDGTPIGTAGVAIGGRDAAGDFQHLRTETSGELLVSFGSAGFATETTLSALNAKVANNFGASIGAVRSASQIGNAGGAADFNSGADSAQTLRVSANLKRAGNELAYNSGAADANTLRSVLATRHEAAGTPLSVQLSNGANFLSDEAIANSQKTVSGGSNRSLLTTSVVLGWDGSQHRELLVGTDGKLINVSEPKALVFEDAQSTVIANTGVTLMTIPAGTVKFKVQALDSNTVNLRMRVDAAPTASVGIQFQPGRSEDYECSGAQLRFIAETAATGQGVEVQFFKA